MKKIIGPVLIINLCLILAVASLLLLAETYPFSPGERGYSLQHASEQLRLRLASNPDRRAGFALALAERRLADLAMAEDRLRVEQSIAAFDRALNKAITLIDASAGQDQASHYVHLEILLNQADIVVAALDPTAAEALLATLEARLHQLLEAESGDDLQALVTQKPKVPASIGAEIVSFLGQDVDHLNFPLEGGHQNLACTDCHADGAYATTPTTCNACHALPAPEPALVAYGRNFPEAQPSYPDHFPGECSDCHGLANWEPTAFDHATVVECASCHASDTPKIASIPAAPQGVYVTYQPAVTFVLDGPADHYPGECQLCHTDTLDWGTAAFEHAGVAECASCHANQAPAQHLPGACANCHSDVEDWANAQVNHTGYADCLSCHLDDDPAEHYAGLCADCHSTITWSEARFNHTGFSDCRTCHQKPANHYPGQCSSCHTEAIWGDSRFTHTAKFYDCATCHSDAEPGNHYINKCSECHSTDQWASASYLHSGGLDCQQCHRAASDHYLGQCSNCHNTLNWANAEMDHTGYSECASCHTVPAGHWGGTCSTCHNTQSWEDGAFAHEPTSDCLSCHQPPAGHYAGQCSNCHNTANWVYSTFDHTGFTDCLACHADETPSGHWPGQCSDCHFVTSWDEIVFNHTSYTNCKACHTRPSNHSQRGQCSNCHTTDSWIIPTTTPAASLRDISGLIPTITPVPNVGEGSSSTPVPPDSREALPTSNIDHDLPSSR